MSVLDCTVRRWARACCGAGLTNRAGYHAELDRLRAEAEAGPDWLTAYEAAERERTGIKNLRVKR